MEISLFGERKQQKYPKVASSLSDPFSQSPHILHNFIPVPRLTESKEYGNNLREFTILSKNNPSWGLRVCFLIQYLITSSGEIDFPTRCANLKH